MKRIILAILVVLSLSSISIGTLTYDGTYYRTHRQYALSTNYNVDPIYLCFNELNTLLGATAGTNTASTALIVDANKGLDYLRINTGGTMLFIPHDGSVPATEGSLYYDASEHTFKQRTNVGYAALGTGTFTGGNITSDVTLADTIAIKSTDTTAEGASIKVFDIGVDYVNVLSWTNGAVPPVVLGDAAVSLAIASTGLNVTTGGAVTGVSTIAASGAISGTTGTFSSGVVLDNAGTITNATDSEFRFLDASEDLIFDMDSASNIVGLKTGTGIVGIAMGDVDDLSGVGTIAFDAAAASISTATTGASQDLTIGISGATDSSLILSSTGTGADALQIATSAGGMDITVAGGVAGEDLDLASNTSITIKSSEASVDDSIVIQTLGAGSGIDITSLGDIDITTTGAATEDISIINSGGSLILRANENDAGAIAIDTTGGGGTSEAITITNDQGTGAASIALQSTAGGVDIDAAAALDLALSGGQVLLASKDNAASAIALTANVGASETIVVTNTQGTSESAITLLATAGGVNIDGATGKDVDIQAGQVKLTSNESVASAISLTTNTGAAETIVVTNTQGTDEAAIRLLATAGGIDIDAATGKNIAVTGGQFNVISNESVASAISFVTNTGAAETIVATNTQGTSESAITLTATAGGVNVDAAAAKDIDLAGGQVLISSKDNVASAIALTANVGASETIVATNTQGTAAGAITLVSTAGGVDIDAAATKDIDLAGGQVLLSSKDDAASAIALTANVGTSETIVVTNTLGTGESAITLNSAAGGVNVDAAAAKDIDLAGGQVKLSSKDDAAGAISLTANTGASETITVTNTQGTGAGAVTLTATAGGITLTSSSGTTVTGSVIRAGQQYVQTISYCKVGTTAGWVVPAAADAAHLATLPASQTNSTLVIPIMIPLKVGYTITAWTINGQIEATSGGTVVVNARLYKHTEAAAGFANATIGAGMTTLTKTADYKIVDGEASLTEVVAADESYYLLVTGTTAADTDVEIAGITVTVSEI